MILRIGSFFTGVILLLTMPAVLSCKSTKTEAVQVDTSKFKEAHIRDMSSKNKDCGFLVQIDESREYFIPPELENEYKVDGLPILIEFVPSRRPQGPCPLGTPITIVNIQPRK